MVSIQTVGSKIKQEREKRKWSQVFLSKKIGINNSVLSRIEADKRPVESELLEKFAEVFEVSTDYILNRTTYLDTSVLLDLANPSIEAQELLNKFLSLPKEKQELILKMAEALFEGEEK